MCGGGIPALAEAAGGGSLKWRLYLPQYVAPVALWMSFIFWLSSRPAADYSRFRGTFDFVPFRQEIVHGILYFVLSWLVARAVSAASRPERRRPPFVETGAGVVIAVLYGFTDEWHQSFVPGRNPSWVGILADTLGAACAATAWLAMTAWRARAGHGPVRPDRGAGRDLKDP